MGAKDQISLMQLSNGDRPIVQWIGPGSGRKHIFTVDFAHNFSKSVVQATQQQAQVTSWLCAFIGDLGPTPKDGKQVPLPMSLTITSWLLPTVNPLCLCHLACTHKTHSCFAIAHVCTGGTKDSRRLRAVPGFGFLLNLNSIAQEKESEWEGETHKETTTLCPHLCTQSPPHIIAPVHLLFSQHLFEQPPSNISKLSFPQNL